MQLELTECDSYYYDRVAAEKPITFAEKYLRLYQDRYAGEPFILCDWQKQATRNLFGWKRRDNKRRRFKECFLLTSKGSGKSPLITAWALYEFLATKQQGQHILSIGTNFPVANITFECAKKLMQASPDIAKMIIETEGDGRSIDIKQYEILNLANNSKWNLMSGNSEGKHGFQTNIVLGDEVWEWDNKKLYYGVKSNLFKRSEPLLLLATNAGTNREGICYDLYERAKKVLDGSSKDETLYPIIYEASSKDDWTADSTIIKANPSIGHTISLDDLHLKLAAAKENAGLEAQFKRENLSLWIQGAEKWLSMEQWDNATAKDYDDNLSELPCYLSLDLSVNDDLSAISAVFVGEKDLTVKSWTYVPRASALHYDEKESIPFVEWANAKHVRLLDSDTVDDTAMKRFEKFIVKLTKKYQVKTLAYDRYKANALIARLEKQGIVCVPVRQTPDGIGQATAELERRLKAGTIVLPDNPCLRWQAANVEVFADKHGNIMPVKEARKGQYAGRRGCKIDAIVSIIIALSEVLKRDIAKVSQQETLNNWNGQILFA